jgi:uncharacterized protein YndB with AHSA1/START domain
MEQAAIVEYRSVTHSAFVIERSYPAAPQRVFAAFADPAKKRRWFAESGRDLEEFQMDFQVGGVERTRTRMGANTPFPGSELSNVTTYQDIIPARRIVFAYTMAMDGRRFSASLATIEFLASGAGTRMIFTEQSAFFEGSDGAERREAGWRELLQRLERELTGQPE